MLVIKTAVGIAFYGNEPTDPGVIGEIKMRFGPAVEVYSADAAMTHAVSAAGGTMDVVGGRLVSTNGDGAELAAADLIPVTQ